MTQTIAVIGAGAWGTTMAIHLAERTDLSIRLWGARPETVALLQETRQNQLLLPGITIPNTITITADPHAATEGASAWVIATPTAYLRTTLERFRGLANPRVRAISLTKGIETETFERPTQIINHMLGITETMVLSGPSHAEEVARGMPTSVVVASHRAELAGWAQHLFGTDRFRVYTNGDPIGVEFAGALKNVIGIAAGVCDGLGFGDNAKAALLTRGIVEMTRFGVTHGAEPATFMGLAGMGDLITTCFSPHGRNRRLGERLARGEALDTILAGPQVAEGVNTAKSVHERSRQMNVEMPIMRAVYELVYKGRSAQSIVHDLMTRRQRDEDRF